MKPGPASLILDLDGTLIDSKPAILESFAHAAAKVFPAHFIDASKISIGPPLPLMFRATFPAASDSQIEELVGEFRAHYAREGIYKTVMFDSVAGALADWHKRQFNLYIATNKPLRLTSAIVSHLGIASFFRAILAADSLVPPFPNKAAMIRHLMGTHRFSSEEAAYVGDTAEDALAAAECDMPFIWVSHGYGQLSAEQLAAAHKTVKHFGELVAFLGR